MMGGSSKFLMLLTTSFPLLCPRPSVFRLARHSRVSLACLPSAAHARFSSKSRLGFPIKASEQIHTQTSNVKGDYTGDSLGFLPNNEVLHPWPEWSKLVENIGTGGYFDRQSPSGAALEGRRSGVEDSFSVIEDLPEEFVRAVSACLSFARDRPDLLGSLSRKDIEVVVENGSPFLFKDALDSARRMRSFLGCSGNSVLEIERAHTVDLMRFLLSYACNPLLASDNNVNNRELVELSVRNLLSELADASRTIQGLDRTGSVPNQFSDRYGQTPKPIAQNIEMKRGDWICVKCSFMNFARNLKCLECNEARPKRQLTGGEWECPQCDFFNYGRNLVCLRCDCKRPGEASYGTTTPRFGLDYSNGSNLNKADIESRLAANDEKAERWFNKVSHLNNASDLGSAIADEDFPEIMPLRKGVNKFVVSTRKTPLERRLANAQYRKDLGNDGTPEGNDFQAGDGGGISPNKTPTSISRSLDRIIGNSYTLSETDNSTAAVENTGTEGTFVSSSASPQYRHSDGNNSGYVPFVPLPADMFGKPQKSNTENEQVAGNYGSVAANSSEPAGSISVGMGSHRSGDGLLLSEKPVNQAEGKDNSEQAEKSERWFKKVAELHDVTDPASAISDEDFPEIMPMRKGENRFVVSKKKDRSLTSPLYKRRMAMEQASNTNFVPFVPFPPDYFAKKDKQPETGASAEKSESETSDVAETSENLPNQSEKSSEGNAVVPDWGASGSSVQRPENQQTSRVSWNASFSGKSYNESKTGAVGGAPTTGNPTQRSDNLPQLENQQTSRGGWNTGFGGKSFNESKTGAVYGAPSTGNSIQRDNLQSSSKESWNSGSSWKESREDSMHLTSQQPANPQNTRESWNRGFSGKSLEGSAVKEPDPLDMSQEAKEQRWFRRVAQIKDISELSNIPDEDFPDIMPMRKGVNRFVVSKRKTPLERRLTSPQYRRNLPIVSSDPVKKENDPS